MDFLKRINDDLTEAFAEYLFMQEHPMPNDPVYKNSTASVPPWLTKYQVDPYFKAKVQSLTEGVMSIVSRHHHEEG